MKKNKEIAIIGSGLLGLTTAYLALKKGYKTTIYSKDPVEKTVSMIAGASFKIHKVGNVENIEEIILQTWKEYENHIDISGNSSVSGVRLGRHIVASMKPLRENDMQYLEAVRDIKRYPQDDKNYKIPGGYKYGISYMTIHINPHLFLPYLVSQIKKQGGRFVERFFTSEEEFDNLPEEIIINCTGLGARELSKDVYMKPLKGQLVICEYSENKLRKYLYHLDSISGDGKYIYPHPEEKKANGKIEIALGGTAEETDNIRPEAKVTEEILKGNMKILPNLKEKSSIAGLRPYRTIGPRIGKRKVGTKTIIDNYGHGGSGYTLCWGSAKKALSYIR